MMTIRERAIAEHRAVSAEWKERIAAERAATYANLKARLSSRVDDILGGCPPKEFLSPVPHPESGEDMPRIQVEDMVLRFADWDGDLALDLPCPLCGELQFVGAFDNLARLGELLDQVVQPCYRHRQPDCPQEPVAQQTSADRLLVALREWMVDRSIPF